MIRNAYLFNHRSEICHSYFLKDVGKKLFKKMWETSLIFLFYIFLCKKMWGTSYFFCLHCVCNIIMYVFFFGLKLSQNRKLMSRSTMDITIVFFINECGFQWRIVNKSLNFWIQIRFIIDFFEIWFNGQVFRKFYLLF